MTRVHISDIKEAVCSRYNVTLRSMRHRSTAQKFARPRHIAMALSRELTELSTSQIGRAFNRDHTMAIWASRKMAALCRENSDLAVIVAALKWAAVDRAERQRPEKMLAANATERTVPRFEESA